MRYNDLRDKYEIFKFLPISTSYTLLTEFENMSSDERKVLIEIFKKELEEGEKRKKELEETEKRTRRGCLWISLSVIVVIGVVFGAFHLFKKNPVPIKKPIVEMSKVDIMISNLIKKYNADTTWVQFYDNLEYVNYVYTYQIENELIKKKQIFIRAIVIEIDSVDSGINLYFRTDISPLKPEFLFILNSDKQFVDSVIKYPSNRFNTAFFDYGDYAIVAKINEINKNTGYLDSLSEGSFIAKGKLIDLVYLGDTLR